MCEVNVWSAFDKSLNWHSVGNVQINFSCEKSNVFAKISNIFADCSLVKTSNGLYSHIVEKLVSQLSCIHLIAS
jgi:ferritin